jgi:DNA-binding beta-propeller fold protein YncE
LKQGQNQWIVEHQSTMMQQVTEQIQAAKNLHKHVEISCDLLHVVEKSHEDIAAVISNTMGDILDMRSIQASHFCISPQSNNRIAESKISNFIIQMKDNKYCAFGDKLKDLLSFNVIRIRKDNNDDAVEGKQNSDGGDRIKYNNNNNNYFCSQYIQSNNGVDEMLSLPFQVKNVVEVDNKPYDCSNGSKQPSFQVSYSIDEVGEFEISVKVRGLSIVNSPFRVKVAKAIAIAISRLPDVPHFGTGKLKGPVDVHFSEGDKIFVSNFNVHNISVFNRSDFSFITAFGSKGDKVGQFDGPYGMASCGDELYVADYGNDRICVFKQSNYTFVTSFRCKDILSSPKFLCLCKEDQRLYATDDRGIISFNLNDHSLHKRFLVSVDNPRGICLSPNASSLYIAELNKHRLVEVDIERDQIMRGVGSYGRGEGELNSPIGVCLSTDGEYVLVSELWNHRISVFKTSDLSFVKHIGSKDDEKNKMNRPWGLFCDENGTSFVADSDNHQVTILNL